MGHRHAAVLARNPARGDAPLTHAAALALSVVALIVFGTIAFAGFAVRRVAADPQQYIVGGRSFGTLLLWMLFAGEIYTSFSFLGAAGWAYGKGAPAVYILAYGTVGYIGGYFLLPAIWRVAKERGLLTAPDFFADRYGSRHLAIGVAVAQAILIVPYVTLQLSGLRTLLTIAGYGGINATVAVGAAFMLIALFVFTAGLRGTAWASVVKDSLVLLAVLFAGIAIPVHFFGSHAAMFDRLLTTHPHWLTLASGTAPFGTVWYVSTVLLTGAGYFMGPHSINAVYSARDDATIRRNMMLMPLYQLVLLFVFFAGFAALLVNPGLTGTNIDQSFMLLLQRHYPPLLVGAIAGAGALAALLPASALLLAGAAVISKNILSDAFGMAMDDRSRVLATRMCVLAIAVLALVLWILWDQTLVGILLVYYNGITQFLPGVVLAFVPRARANAVGVAAGIAAGFAVAIGLAISHSTTLEGVNSGFVALLANVAVCLTVSAATQKNKPAETAGL